MNKEIANWGNYPKQNAELSELEFINDIQQLVAKSATILARADATCRMRPANLHA